MIHISVGGGAFTSLCQQITHCLPQAHSLCSENVAIGFKTSIEAYLVQKTQHQKTGSILAKSPFKNGSVLDLLVPYFGGL